MPIRFRAPNFRPKVRETTRPEAQPFFRITYAADEGALRTYLVSLGLEVLEVHPYDFSVWLTKAADETTAASKARSAGNLYTFDSKIWGELKHHLQDLFYGRCAYCEAWFKSVSFGDVEHFRPKGHVAEDPAHPGYYWLAYNHLNYLPSCMQCNQKAKGDHFPVIEGTRAYTPDKLSQEVPLLFDPHSDDPRDHFKYIPSTGNGSNGNVVLAAGWVGGKTKKGEMSVVHYNLNRGDLIQDRLATLQAARLAIKFALLNGNISRLISPQQKYCTAIVAEIDDYYQEVNAEFERVKEMLEN